MTGAVYTYEELLPQLQRVAGGEMVIRLGQYTTRNLLAHIARLEARIAELSIPPESCYCVCHSPYSSRAWCLHCGGDNAVGRHLRETIESRIPALEARLAARDSAKDAVVAAATMLADSCGETGSFGDMHETYSYIALGELYTALAALDAQPAGEVSNG